MQFVDVDARAEACARPFGRDGVRASGRDEHRDGDGNQDDEQAPNAST